MIVRWIFSSCDRALTSAESDNGGSQAMLGRVLNRIIGLFLVRDTLMPLTFIGISLAVIGANYQAGHTWVDWHVFGYFPLAAFALIAFAFFAAHFQDEAGYKATLWVAALYGTLFGSEPTRFAGVHLHWWYLALVVGSTLFMWLEPGWEEDEYSGDRWFSVPFNQRIGNLLGLFAIPTVSLTCFLAYGWAWSTAFWVLVADVSLFVLSRMVGSKTTQNAYQTAVST